MVEFIVATRKIKIKHRNYFYLAKITSLKTWKCIKVTIATKFIFNISVAATNLRTNLVPFVFFKHLLFDVHDFSLTLNSLDSKQVFLAQALSI